MDVDFFNISNFFDIVAQLYEISVNKVIEEFFYIVIKIMNDKKCEVSYLDSRDISQLKNKKTNIKNSIKDFFKKKENKNLFLKEFKNFKYNINYDIIEKVKNELKELYTNDINLNINFKEQLNIFFENELDEEFICYCFFYSLNMNNKNNFKIDNSFYLNLTNYLCPLDNNELIKFDSNLMPISLYKITDIYSKEYKFSFNDTNINNSYENKIVLCNECHERYINYPTEKIYKKLKEININLIKSYEINKKLKLINVEEELKNIIEKLNNFQYLEKELKLNYNPVTLKNKIEKENVILLREITDNVTLYFKYIQNLMKTILNENYEILANQIRNAYLELKKFNLKQEEIFVKLNKWLCEKLCYSFESHQFIFNIIISFFIQNCEVFDEIS